MYWGDEIAQSGTIGLERPVTKETAPLSLRERCSLLSHKSNMLAGRRRNPNPQLQKTRLSLSNEGGHLNQLRFSSFFKLIE